MQRDTPARKTPSTILWLTTLILLLAAFLRFYRLSEVPPGLGYDESTVIADAWRFGQHRALPQFQHPQPPEIMARMAQGVLMALVGPSPFVGRLASAFWGVLGVAVTFQAGRAVARGWRHRNAAGLAAAGVLAVLLNHIVNSRMGYRAITLPPFEAAAIACLANAWHTNKRRRYVWAGVLLGLSAQTYLPGLIMPMMLVPLLLHQLVFRFREMRARLANVGLLVLIMLLVMLPLAIQEIALPGPLYERINDAGEGAFDTSADSLSRLRNLPLLWWKAAEGFYLRGDWNPKANVASAPLLTPVLVMLALPGVAICLLAPRRLTSALLLGLLVAMLLPVALSDSLWHGLRIGGEFVVVAALSGLTAAASLDGLTRWRRRIGRTLGGAALALVIAWQGFSAGQTYFTYFDDPANWDATAVVNLVWYFQVEDTEFATSLSETRTPTYLPLEVFNTPVYRLILARRFPRIRPINALPIEGGYLALEDGQVIIPTTLHDGALPTTYVLLRPAPHRVCCGEVFLLPALPADAAAALYDRVVTEGDGLSVSTGTEYAQRLDLSGEGNPFHELPPLPDGRLATFGNRLQLVRWDAPRTISPGEEIVVTLYWRSIGRQLPYYLSYVHLLDRFGNGLTAGGDHEVLLWAYSPPEWRRGDVVPHVTRLRIPDDLPPGPYGLLIGVYPYAADPLPVAGPDGTVLGDSFQLWSLKVAAPSLFLPEGLTALDAMLGGLVQLGGYTITQNDQEVTFADLTPGQPFTLTLYWRSLQTLSDTYHIFVHVQAPDGSVLAASDGPPQDGAYPTMIWDAGEIVATRHTLTLPPETGTFTVHAGLYSWPDLTRLPVVQNGERTPDERVVLWPLP